MTLEPQPNYELEYTPPPEEANRPVAASKQLPAGSFVGRTVEQGQYRQVLQEMLNRGGKKGLFSGLFGGKKNKPPHAIQSRLLLIGGEPGAGKTRLAQRLREIAQKEREFSRKFRTTRLDWQEYFERDTRLTTLLNGEAVKPEIVLDIIFSHCQRDNGTGYFETYKAAIADTKKLADSVIGTELEAVWEFRAKALGSSLADWSSERLLLFFMDNCHLIKPSLELLLPGVLETAGAGVSLILCGETLPNISSLMPPENLTSLQPGAFTEDELRELYQLELARYEAHAEEDRIEFNPLQSSHEVMTELQEVTGGYPLAVRFSAFMLQTGIGVSELLQEHPPNSREALAALVEEFFERPLATGHPDRLRLYAAALLRRPELGLLAAMFDTRRDMLSLEEMNLRMSERYTFLFEPGRPMVFHPAVSQPLRHWLTDPARRYEEAGLEKLNRLALDYLGKRLVEWENNFPSLRERVADLKWREWSLDKIWHSFWLDEERGWQEALAHYAAGLGLRPDFARQVVALIEQVEQASLLSEGGVRRVDVFRQVLLAPQDVPAMQRELQVMAEEGGYVGLSLPAFEQDLIKYLKKL